MLGLIKEVATVVLPIVGVMAGAKLAGRSADEQWLKKERLAAYLELIDQLSSMAKHFALGMRVSKFSQHEESEDHNEDTAEEHGRTRWRSWTGQKRRLCFSAPL